MDKEIKYLLEEIKDNTYDYVGTNGCLYQDLSREELNLLLEYISNLQNQVQKYKEVIDRAKTELEQGITFCQNDSQGLYDKCNIAINREQRILDILKEVE